MYYANGRRKSYKKYTRDLTAVVCSRRTRPAGEPFLCKKKKKQFIFCSFIIVNIRMCGQPLNDLRDEFRRFRRVYYVTVRTIHTQSVYDVLKTIRRRKLLSAEIRRHRRRRRRETRDLSGRNSLARSIRNLFLLEYTPR